MVKQIRPMLAEILDIDKLQEWLDKGMVVGELKPHGERSLLHVQTDGSAVITSHQMNKKGTMNETSDLIPHLTAPGTWPEAMYGTILDGEMAHPDGSRRTASIFRSMAPKAIALQKEYGPIEYHVFDVLEFNGKDLIDWKSPLSERRKYLASILYYDKIPAHVKLVPQEWNDMKGFFKRAIDAGEEEIILKRFDDPYVPGSRSYWMIVKISNLPEGFHHSIVHTGFREWTLDEDDERALDKAWKSVQSRSDLFPPELRKQLEASGQLPPLKKSKRKKLQISE